MRDLTRTGSYISTRIGRAIADYGLIEDGDRILVAVSGGKDSLTLLKLLNERRKWAPVSYELVAAHIQTDYRCAGCIHVDALKKFFGDNGVKYHVEKIKIRNGRKGEVSCFWCSWNRRKTLFELADKFGCNKVALGHHMDDIVETLLLNIFYHGEFSAMNPRQELFGGKIVIIRPLCYVEESATRAFARESAFPPQACRCPNSKVSKRRKMKEIIRDLERDCGHAKTNIFRSIGRINREYTRIGNFKLNQVTEGGETDGTEGRKGRCEEEKGVSLLHR
jgi:tRNA 2-thiocytidine biosynthesis protein TtcA